MIKITDLGQVFAFILRFPLPVSGAVLRGLIIKMCKEQVFV